MNRLLLGLSVVLLLAEPGFAQQYPQNRATVNASVVIAAGNTFQTVLAALVPNNRRNSLTIQNNQTTTDNCWIFIGPTASATKGTSILLPPGQAYTRYYPFIPSDNIAGTCLTTSDTLYVDWQ